MNKALSAAERGAAPIAVTMPSRLGEFEVVFEPATTAPDWVVIMRASFAWGQLQLDALREVDRRSLRLASDRTSHDRLYREFTASAFATGGF